MKVNTGQKLTVMVDNASSNKKNVDVIKCWSKLVLIVDNFTCNINEIYSKP